MDEEVYIHARLHETQLHLKGAQVELILALRSLLDLLIEASEKWAAQKGLAPKNQLLHAFRTLLDLALGRLDARDAGASPAGSGAEALCDFRSLVEETLADMMNLPTSSKRRAQIEAFEAVLAMLDQEIELARSSPSYHGTKSAGIRKVVIE